MDLQPGARQRGVLLCPGRLGLRPRGLRQALGQEGGLQAARVAADAVGELRAEREDEEGG